MARHGLRGLRRRDAYLLYYYQITVIYTIRGLAGDAEWYRE